MADYRERPSAHPDLWKKFRSWRTAARAVNRVRRETGRDAIIADAGRGRGGKALYSIHLRNPQRWFDPFDYAGGAAEAKRERDSFWRERRRQGKTARRMVLRGQLEPYRGLGTPGRGTRDVYGVDWRENVRRNPRQSRFRQELKKLLRRGVPAHRAMKQAWRKVPKNPRHRRNRVKVTRHKARAILHHKRARGHPLTPAQRGLFGAIASGYPLRQYNAPTPIRFYGNGRLIGVIGFRPTRGRRIARNPRIDIRV